MPFQRPERPSGRVRLGIVSFLMMAAALGACAISDDTRSGASSFHEGSPEVLPLVNAPAIEPSWGAVTRAPGEATRAAVVEWKNLGPGTPSTRQYPHPYPLSPRHLPGAGMRRVPEPERLERDAERFTQPKPLAPSPALVASFDGLDDDDTSIPPDTSGAAGPTQLMVALNTQVRIQDKLGNALSTTTLGNFFASLGYSEIFDPHVLYDPLASRWIVAAVADAQLATSAIVIAVSKTTDATGTWYLYGVQADATGTNWADFPAVGVNKNWIAVSVNLFPNVGNGFGGTETLIFDKAVAYANGSPSGKHTTFSTSGNPPQDDFTIQPASSFDPADGTLYFLETYDGTQSLMRLFSVTGPVGSETWNKLADVTLPVSPWADQTSLTNSGFAPQLGSTVHIDTGDSRMHTLVARNGTLWGSMGVFLPVNAPSRASAQWFEIAPSTSKVLQAGRVDDATGAQSFAYSSLAVNKYGDALLGYSRFSATQYASADYAVRFAYDPLNVLRDDTVYKAGIASYAKTFGGTRNRWGDYSNTVVDPSDDLTMWTLEEYAAAHVVSKSRWGTWWGKVAVNCTGQATGDSCDDGQLCNQGPKTCQGGACVGGGPVVCAALDQCHVAGTCDTTTGICSQPARADGSTCNDGNACTQLDSCQSGVCVGSNPVVCATTDACGDVSQCDKGTGACLAPACPAPDTCHTVGACDPVSHVCSNPAKADATPCNDNNACTQTDSCLSGVCMGASPIVCTALDQCHDVGTCAPATGVCSQPAKSNGTTCDDGDPCTSPDRCQLGVCKGASVQCLPTNACHVAGTCDPVSGLCSDPLAVDGTACTGPDVCVAAYACQAGTCSAAGNKTCAPADDCHTAACDPTTGKCAGKAKPDGTACAGGKRCQAGACVGAPPIADAAAPGDGAVEAGGDAGGDGGVSGNGCGCRVGERGSPRLPFGAGGIAMLGVLVVRRRRVRRLSASEGVRRGRPVRREI